MAVKRGTYRFAYTGSNFSSWLDGRFEDACGVGLKGYIVGNEDQGMIVIEGKSGDVDALANDIDNDSDTSDFLALKEEDDVTPVYGAFREFKEADACDEC